MNRKIKYSIFILFVLGFFSASMYMCYHLIQGITYQDVYMHELVHKKIYAYGGCNSSIFIDVTEDKTSGYTIREENCSIFDAKEINRLHLLNEIAGYNTTGIEQYLCWILTVIILYSTIMIIHSTSRDFLSWIYDEKSLKEEIDKIMKQV